MMNRMVAEHMTFVYNALHDIGACLAVFHGDEEQSLYAFFIQRIDDPCRISVFVSEVEGKIYLVRIRCYKCRAVLTVSVLKHGCAGRAVIRIDIDAGTEAVLGVIEGFKLRSRVFRTDKFNSAGDYARARRMSAESTSAESLSLFFI